ncbi:TonB-dependent receptor [Joostella atrarenae]|uniref:TonB-dependent receptor n=1 Tax=Joostella atrarenae TaxID=679257 RepID=A0ABS9IYV8_9FLAO|nr:TonB-dependent receptor [Joostella atrarenae]MCF8713366.1 TonB-dependent receptor [Joostella atrarenae]
MELKIKWILTLLCIAVTQFALSQEKTITGTVVSAADGFPLPGANIVVLGTTNGVQTDFDGKFSLNTKVGETITISYIGFKSIDVKISGANNINISLQEDAHSLDEVIVVAYGTTKKEDFTGSATQINSEQLETRVITNAINALDGASAGVNVSAPSGQPGSTPNIRIRGTGSFNASSSPLYIVDGVQFTGELSSINSNDIESMTVLKDAASTSLYGSRAGNGVVLISTKKGKQGKSKVSLNVSQGITTRSIEEYDRVNAQQYYPLMWEAYRNGLSISGNTPTEEANMQASSEIFERLGYNPFNVANDQIVLTNGQLNPDAQLKIDPQDLDWQSPLIRTGARQNVDFSYQGANENTDYYASLGYLNEEGYLANSDYERVSARINVNSKLKEWVKAGLNLSGASSISNQAADGNSTGLSNPFFVTRRMSPIYPVHLHDVDTGNYILDDEGQRIYDSGEYRIGSSNGRNIVQETELNVDRDKIFSFSGRTYAEFYFLKDFTFTLNASLDKRFYHNEEFDNPIVGDGAPDGRAGRTSTTRSTQNYNQLLRYDKEFGKHSISALLGHENFETEYNYLDGTRREEIIEGNTELVNFTNITDLESYTNRQTTEGYFSRVNYDFDNRYYISGSFRRDGSSRFHENTWGNFYSVGGAWRIDQEAFIKQIDWINLLKLRASYGEVGNDDLGGYYVSQALFDLGFNNATEGGILLESAGNPNLKWETNVQTDYALEFGFLQNRITGTLEYYRRKSQDILFEVPLPISSGLDDYPANIGSWTNKGIEIELQLGIVRNQNFSWDLGINASTLDNEINELPQEEIIDGSKKLVVGGDIYDYWLRDWYGVDPSDGAALYIADPELIEENDDEIRTIDGTNVTTNQSKALYDFVGSATPDLFGSIRNNFRYHGIELGFMFTYQLGGETYDRNYSGIMHSGTYGTALSTDILNRWQQPGDITDVPRLDTTKTTAFGAGSSRWLTSSDYLALRQVSLSYNFDSSLIDALGLGSLKIYASGENLFKITDRKGMDVGENFNGTTSNRFTPARVISLGLNVTF